MGVQVVPFEEQHRADVLALSHRAWAPVMPQMQAAVPGYVYDAFYPHGWWERQRHILAVDPEHQRAGIATALIAAAHDHMRSAGMTITMVETGDDPGHQSSRTTYEHAGYERWPVARYFRQL